VAQLFFLLVALLQRAVIVKNLIDDSLAPLRLPRPFFALEILEIP